MRLAAFALALLFAGAAHAETKVALSVAGSKRTGAPAIEKVLRAELEKAGYAVVKSKAEPDAAKSAGAAILVRARIAKAKRKATNLVLEVMDADSGELIDRASQGFKGRKQSPPAARALIRQLLDPIAATIEQKREAAKPKRPAPVVVEAPPPAPPPPPVENKPAAPPPSRAADPAGDTPIVVLRAFGGTQAATAYTVAVGGAATALAYRLSPLLRVGADVRFNVPSTGLGIEARFGLAPVKYRLETQPAVTPSDPGGMFIDAGALVSYRIPFAVGFGEISVEPLLAFGVESLGVDAQLKADDMQPLSIVIGATGLVPQLGTRAGLRIGEDLELLLDARLRIVASYSESPARTGESGAGIGLGLGGEARYWLSRLLGLSLGVGYEFASVGFKGRGDRATFEDDPVLEDASVLYSDLRVDLGVLLAF